MAGEPDPLERVRAALADHAPHLRDARIAPLGNGLDHAAFEVGGTLVVRCRTSSAAPPARREALLLDAVASVAPVAVPRPLFVDEARDCLAYEKLSGVPLLDVPAHARRASATVIAAALGPLLAALQAVPTDLVERDATPPEAWREEATTSQAAAADGLPRDVRPRVQRFLARPAPAPGGVLRLAHDDLGIEHVLVDPETLAVTGVIDWSDAAITDPAQDLGRILRDLGAAALQVVLRRCGVPDDAALRTRVLFFARCGLLEDLVYGLETGKRAYVEKSRAAAERLFAG